MSVAGLQGVDILTFGQYLQPTPLHLTVKQQVTPEKFEYWRKYGEDVVRFRYATQLLPELMWSVCYNTAVLDCWLEHGLDATVCCYRSVVPAHMSHTIVNNCTTA